MTAPGGGASGIRLTPNQVLPSQRRCRARVAIGSLPLAAVSGSIVVNTHRSEPLAARNVTGPIRSRRQPSSAQAGAPATTTFGRNRVIGSGPSAARGPAAISSLSRSSEPVLASSSG